MVPLLTYLLTKDELSLAEVNGMAIDVVTGGVDTVTIIVVCHSTRHCAWDVNCLFFSPSLSFRFAF